MCSMLQNQGTPLRKVLITGASFLKCNTIYRLIDWEKFGFKAYMEPAGGMGLLKMTRIDPDILILMDNLAWTDTVRLINKFNVRNSKSEILIITDDPQWYHGEPYNGVQLLPSKGMDEQILTRALRNSGISNHTQQDVSYHQLLIGDRRQLRRIADTVDSDRVLLCRIEPETDPLKDPSLLQKMEALLEKEVPDRWFQEISGKYMLCFGILDVGIMEQLKLIHSVISSLRKKARGILGNHIAVYISDTVTKDNIIEAYLSLYNMCPYRFFITGDAVISSRLIREEFPGIPINWESVNEKYSSLLERIICSKKEEAAVILRSIFYEDIIKSGSHPAYNQIIFQIENILKCMAIIFNVSVKESNLSDTDHWNIEDALDAELDLLEKIMHEKKEEHREYSPIVTDTLLSICKHHNDQIYVGSLAQEANVSESYLSRIFKQQTGMGISKCINYMRIYMAGRDLIRNDLKISEVAEAHGFYDSKYFSKTFRQIMGYTPSEWRNMYKGDREDQ